MKQQLDVNALLAENKKLKSTLKRVYLALNPKMNNKKDKNVIIQWTPKEEVIVKEEVARNKTFHAAYLAMRKRGITRSEGAVCYRWYNKLKND